MVAGVALDGETEVIDGLTLEYAKACGLAPHVPSGFTTTTVDAFAIFAGVVARIVCESTTAILAAASPPKYTLADLLRPILRWWIRKLFAPQHRQISRTHPL